MKDQAVPVVEVINNSISYLDNSMESVVATCPPTVRKLEVVCIIGPEMTGKSFLLNHIAAVLLRKAASNAFPWGNRRTMYGIWAYPNVIVDPAAPTIGILLLDVQGLFSHEVPDAISTALSTIACGISSHILLNSQFPPDRNALDSIIHVLNYASIQLSKRAGMRCDRFESLDILLRNCPGAAVDLGGENATNNPMQDILLHRLGAIATNRSCTFLPDPGSAATVKLPGGLSGPVSQPFQQTVSEYVDSIRRRLLIEPRVRKGSDPSTYVGKVTDVVRKLASLSFTEDFKTGPLQLKDLANMTMETLEEDFRAKCAALTFPSPGYNRVIFLGNLEADEKAIETCFYERCATAMAETCQSLKDGRLKYILSNAEMIVYLRRLEGKMDIIQEARWAEIKKGIDDDNCDKQAKALAIGTGIGTAVVTTGIVHHVYGWRLVCAVGAGAVGGCAVAWVLYTYRREIKSGFSGGARFVQRTIHQSGPVFFLNNVVSSALMRRLG